MPLSFLASCGHRLPEDLSGDLGLCPYCNAPRGTQNGPLASFAYGPPQSPAGAYPGFGPMPLAAPGSVPPGGAPGKGLRIAGGVLSIVVGAVLATSGVFLVTVGAKWFVRFEGDAMLICGIIAISLGALGMTFGALACAGKAAGAIGGGVVMSILAALTLLAMAAESTTILLGVAMACVSASVFSFLGIGQCKAWHAYRAAGGR